jgi:hypothetical protein
MITQAARYANREEWLTAALVELAPLFAEQGRECPELIRVACGWPKGSRRAIGQCWSQKCSADGAIEIFVSPTLDGPTRILDVLIHELCHAVVGVEHGHKAPFKRLAKKIGLEGKATETVASDALAARLRPIADRLGSYPHAALVPTDAETRKQTTRLVKAECRQCGYTVRVTRKWVEVGPPCCPLHGPMEADEPGEADED